MYIKKIYIINDLDNRILFFCLLNYDMVDPDVCIFDETDHYRTPLANIKAFSREMDEWSAITIGEQTLKEKMYTFFMIF